MDRRVNPVERSFRAWFRARSGVLAMIEYVDPFFREDGSARKFGELRDGLPYTGLVKRWGTHSLTPAFPNTQPKERP